MKQTPFITVIDSSKLYNEAQIDIKNGPLITKEFIKQLLDETKTY